jgi:glycosyltransferase involved in cell wall biosynthesis
MTNSTRPLVTIAIPTYNRADAFLRNALTCAVNQTYPNLEILVSDNCSSDHTADVVREFTDPRIRYFRQEHNIGANNNFNFCLSQAQGDYFLLLLDDDQVDNDFIETCMDAADKPDIGLIRTGTRLLDGDGSVLFERPNKADGLSLADFFLAWFDNKTTLFVCSTLFNTRHLQDIGGFQSRHCLFQDVITEAKIIAKHGRLDIEEVKAGFRKHDENMGSAAKVSAWCEDSLDLLKLICSLAPEQSELLRQRGQIFFCKMNYSYAAAIPSPLKRYSTYLTVARMFDYSYSPLRYAIDKDLRPRLRRTKRKFKQLLLGNSTT